jgi:two-component system chemotaxis response regulator CheY
LLVDDSETVLLSLQTVLTKSGFGVEVARDGGEALRRITDGLRPDLVISDLNMPGVDGIAFARQLRAEPPTRFTPILLLTVVKDQAKRVEAKSAGVTGWLVKPIQVDQLLSVIGRLLPTA